MLNGHGLPKGYADQLETFKQNDAARASFVQELIRNYEELQVKYSETVDDYNNEVESRRMWQSKATSNERALNEQKQVSGSNSFVLAIIDGDGAIFQDFLLRLGKDGGADAAGLLHAEIKSHLKKTYEAANVDDWSIVVHVVMNLHGLATKLVACGELSSISDMLEFARAFGLAQPLFSFIDVGSGKERADHKIRETLRLFLPNTQCKHVFFGPCSDNGYLPVLQGYKRDYASKLTLVETRAAETGFVELGLPIVRFPRIFRSDNLPCKPITVPFAPLSQMHTPPTAAPIEPPSRSASMQMQATCVPFVPRKASPAASSDSGTGSTWATVGKSGANGKTINIASKKTPLRPHVLVNVHDQRVDAELPKWDPGAEKRFGERLKMEGKFCNSYHLLGRCDTGEYCDYNHGSRLSPGEQLVLKHKARSRSCPKKSACRDIDCTFGHHCKFGRSCMQETCWFADTHRMETQPAKRVYEDGSEEWIQTYLDKFR